MNDLTHIESADLAMLVALAPAERLGAIIRLNRTVRYANTLNAVELLVQLAEQAAVAGSLRKRHRIELSDSVSSIPGSSESSSFGLGAGIRFAPNSKKQ